MKPIIRNAMARHLRGLVSLPARKGPRRALGLVALALLLTVVVTQLATSSPRVASAAEGDRITSYSLTWRDNQENGVTIDGSQATLEPAENSPEASGTSVVAVLKFQVGYADATMSTIEPGELRVTLPAYVFMRRDETQPTRDGNVPQGTFDLGIPDKVAYEADPSAFENSLYWARDDSGTPDDPSDDLIVITNHDSIQESTAFSIDIEWSSTNKADDPNAAVAEDTYPRGIRGGDGSSGYTRDDIDATLEILDDDGSVIESKKTEALGVRYSTSVVVCVQKRFEELRGSWNEAWGDEPQWRDGEGSYYILWAIDAGGSSGTYGDVLSSIDSLTQPGTLTLTDTGSGSSFVGWWYVLYRSSEDARLLESAPSLDISYDEDDTSFREGGEAGGGELYAITRYPRSVVKNGSYRASNTVSAWVVGDDGAKESDTGTASYTIQDTELDYPDNQFNFQKYTGTAAFDTTYKTISGAATALDVSETGTEDVVRVRFRLKTDVTGGRLTLSEGGDPDNISDYGRNSYKIEIVDDTMSLAGSQLEEGDYSISDVSLTPSFSNGSRYIPARTEYAYAQNELGQWGEEEVPVNQWSPVTVEYKVRGSGEWETLGTATYLSTSSSVGSSTIEFEYADGRTGSSIELPEGVTGIRLSYETTCYRSVFIPQLTVSLNATEHVKSIVGNGLQNGSTTVVLRNSATRRVVDYKGTQRDSTNSSSTSSLTGGSSSMISKSGTGFSAQSGGAATGSYYINVVDYVSYSSISGLSQEMVESSGLVHRQDSGVVYDLLPRGLMVDVSSVRVWENDSVTRSGSDWVFSTRSYAGSSSHESCESSVELVRNWRGSGRTMMIIHVEVADGDNGLRTAESAAVPKNSCTYSGFHVEFDFEYSQDSFTDYGSSLTNYVAYQSGDGLNTGSYDDGGTFGGDVRAWLSDVDDDGDTSSETELTLYASYTRDVTGLTSYEASSSKRVQAESDLSWKTETEVGQGETYSYRLRVGATEGTLSDIVLYDSLERPEGEKDAEYRWYGTLESIDVTQPESRGVSPVVYYSTVKDLQLSADSQDAGDRDLTKQDIWSTTPPDDLSAVRAIAIDLRRASGGGDYTLPDNTTLSVIINMRAPSDTYECLRYQAEGAQAVNDYTLSTTQAGTSRLLPTDTVSATIHAEVSDFSFTKVDGSNGDAPLGGATFRLYRWTGSGEAPAQLIDPDNLADGWEQVGDGVTSDSTTGSVVFPNLGSGVYRLVEVQAPDGYKRPLGQWSVLFDASDPSHATITGVSDEGDTSSTPPAFATNEKGALMLPNYEYLVLPASGGVGTGVVVGIGAALVVAALVWRLRRT